MRGFRPRCRCGGGFAEIILKSVGFENTFLGFLPAVMLLISLGGCAAPGEQSKEQPSVNGEVAFLTKGDNVEMPDSDPILPAQILGIADVN